MWYVSKICLGQFSIRTPLGCIGDRISPCIICRYLILECRRITHCSCFFLCLCQEIAKEVLLVSKMSFKFSMICRAYPTYLVLHLKFAVSFCCWLQAILAAESFNLSIIHPMHLVSCVVLSEQAWFIRIRVNSIMESSSLLISRQ